MRVIEYETFFFHSRVLCPNPEAGIRPFGPFSFLLFIGRLFKRQIPKCEIRLCLIRYNKALML